MTGRIELVFFAPMLPSTYPTLRSTEIWVSTKITVLTSRTLSQTPDLENFATSRSRCQQLVVVDGRIVDDTYTTVDELWLFTTSWSTVTL